MRKSERTFIASHIDRCTTQLNSNPDATAEMRAVLVCLRLGVAFAQAKEG